MLGETIMSLTIFFGSIFMYYQATQLRQIETYQNVGPDFWPKLIIMVLIAISGYLSIHNIKRQIQSTEKPDALSDRDGGVLRVTSTTLIIIGYILLLKPLGFIMASPLLIAAMMFQIQPDKKKAIPVGIVGILVVIYVLFGRLLLIPLPKGQGFFRDISIFLGL
jgi:hypothetical protein